MAPDEPDTAPRRRATLVGLGVFITLFATPAKLGKLPLQSLIKDGLHLDPEAMADFFAVAALAFYLKPIAGVLTDYIPFFGSRRRHYLLLSGLAGAALWGLAATTRLSYSVLLVAFIALNSAAVLGNTVIGGVLVETSHTYGHAGRLSAIRVGAMYTAALVAGPLGGWLAERSFGWTCAIGALSMIGLTLASRLLLRDAPGQPVQARPELAARFSQLVRSRTLWTAAAFSFFVYAAPGFQNVLYYFQRDALGLTVPQIGLLTSVNAGASILAAICYVRFSGRISLRERLSLGICLYAVSSLFYLGYRSLGAALVIEAASGFVGTLGILPLQDLAVHATPRRNEALGYAVIIAIGNLGISLSEIIGTRIASFFHLSFTALVPICALASALTLSGLLLLPRTSTQ